MLLDRLTSRHANVGTGERIASSVAGLGLVIAGFTRHRIAGFALVAAGVALLQRGVRGQCALYSALGIDNSEQAKLGRKPLDKVDQASADSFPASDAPARNSFT